jgi:uncharacterized protein YkwD
MLVGTLLFVLSGMWSSSPAGEASALQPTQEPQVTITVAKATPTEDLALKAAQWLYISAAQQPTATSTPQPPAPAASQPQQASSPPGAPPASVPASAQPAGCPTEGISGYALDLFNAINDARAQNGVFPLAADGCDAYIAQIRSNDMATRNYFAHQSPDGSTAFSLLDAYGVPNGWAGENLARNNYPLDQTVAVAIRDLMASPPHRENILNVHYTSLGVAVAEDGTGILYYTMIFTGPP